MKITAYQTAKLKKISVYITDKIESAPEPNDSFLEEYRENIKHGACSMCNFQYYNSYEMRWIWTAIPWDFVISIEED